MSIAKLYTVFLVVAAMRLSATTVVIAVSNVGVAVSTDSKTTARAADYSTTGEIEQPKHVILNDRIAVVSIGVSDYRDAGRHFNFLTWMNGLQLRISKDVSVDDLASLIARESNSTFVDLGIAKSIAKGTLKNVNHALPCEIFPQFVIVGYQGGTARIYRVEFDIDWNHHEFVGPIRTLLYPDGAQSNYRIIRFGAQEAITDFFNGNSYAHQQAMRICPRATANFDGLTYPSFEETVCVTRALVQVEESTNPDSVGGSIRTVEVLPSGLTKEYTTGAFAESGGGNTKKNPQ